MRVGSQEENGASRQRGFESRPTLQVTERKGEKRWAKKALRQAIICDGRRYISGVSYLWTNFARACLCVQEQWSIIHVTKRAGLIESAAELFSDLIAETATNPDRDCIDV